MMDEGTRSRTASQIALEAEAMGTSMATNCTWDGAFVSFRCLKSLFEPSLNLAVDLLREPTYPDAEWDRILAQTLGHSIANATVRNLVHTAAFCGRSMAVPSYSYRSMASSRLSRT